MQRYVARMMHCVALLDLMDRCLAHDRPSLPQKAEAFAEPINPWTLGDSDLIPIPGLVPLSYRTLETGAIALPSLRNDVGCRPVGRLRVDVGHDGNRTVNRLHIDIVSIQFDQRQVSLQVLRRRFDGNGRGFAGQQ
jgi:hypothetical protein